MSCPTSQKINNRKGFTLVEVLLVLVIISIMAGLLITVIDPVKQRGRARDGTIIATANKIIAAVQAYNSAIGSYPTCVTLVGGTSPEVQNATALTGCTAGEGSFSMNGLVTPVDVCDAAFYAAGTQTGACKFRYESSGTRACLGIRLNLPVDLNNDGTPGQYLFWDSGTAAAGGTNGAVSDATTGTCNVI